jgi:hypothetical protein
MKMVQIRKSRRILKFLTRNRGTVRVSTKKFKSQRRFRVDAPFSGPQLPFLSL